VTRQVPVFWFNDRACLYVRFGNLPGDIISGIYSHATQQGRIQSCLKEQANKIQPRRILDNASLMTGIAVFIEDRQVDPVVIRAEAK